jgi:hypothetical protein
MTGINVIPTILPLPLQATYLARDLDSSPFSLTENGDQPVMCEPTTGAAQAAPQFNLPTFNQECVRHILLGDYSALVDAINRMATLGYCERIAWSQPLPTGRNGEFISVMTRKRTLP